MADVKISELPVATSVDASDVAPIVHSGVTVKATAAQLTTAALDDTPVTVAQGGTNATTASAARTNLGAASSAITISAGTGLSGGGDLTANRTISLANTTVTAGAYGAPAKTLELAVNAQGQITGIIPVDIAVDWSAVSNAPYIEVATTVGTTTITTTPQLLKPTTIVGTHPGIDYDPTTGEFTFNEAGNYGLSVAVNALATTAGESIYWYAENNTGSGWVVNTNAGKSFGLVNNVRSQVFAANFARRTAGQKVRYWIYSSSDTKVSIAPTTLGTTGAIVPAIRVQYSG